MRERLNYSQIKMRCLVKIQKEFPTMSIIQMHKIFNLAWVNSNSLNEIEDKLEDILELFRGI